MIQKRPASPFPPARERVFLDQMAQTLWAWDTAIFLWINRGWASPWLDWLMPWISGVVPLVPVLAAAVWVALKDGAARWPILVGLAALFLLTDFVPSQLLRPWLERLRPYAILEGARHFDDAWQMTQGAVAHHAGAFGLPSCHASNSMGPALYLGCFHRRLGWILAGLALASGLSRVYLGVHFPGDVVAGFLWGGLCGWALGMAVRSGLTRWRPKRAPSS
jgi:undecaprenyl-diphosphatase